MSHPNTLMTTLNRLCLDTPTPRSLVTFTHTSVDVIPLLLDFHDDDSRDSGFESQGSDSEDLQDSQDTRENKQAFVVNRPLFSGKRSHYFLEECSTSKQDRHDNISDCTNTIVTSYVMKSAVDKMDREENLIGDGSKSHCLPTLTGRHTDLKSVAPHTVSELLQGAYSDVISEFKIVDCRYPYEYEGGHIEGAVNLVDEDQVEKLLTSYGGESVRRRVLIFHCEFSSERGPKLLRHLRSMDRKLNSDRYPLLTFPEVYLMEGGYKAFFEQHQVQCQPRTYRPMLHEDYTNELRHFRSRSTSRKTGKHQKRSARRIQCGDSLLKCSLY